MDKVIPYIPLFKVAIELQKPGTEGYFADLKSLCNCDGNDNPFGFLNKLIDELEIDPDAKPPDYKFLIEKVKFSSKTNMPPLYQNKGAIILNILGCVTEIPILVTHPTPIVGSNFNIDSSDSKMVPDSSMISNILECSVLIVKFDIDHLCGMAWPLFLYNNFRDNTEKICREQLPEIDTSKITTIEECNEILLPMLLSAKCDTIIIVILGFSANNNNESMKSNFVLASPSHKVANLVYSLKDLYGLIDSHEKLSKKEKIIVLLTLPSKQLKYENDDKLIVEHEKTHPYYLPINSIILASTFAHLKNFKDIACKNEDLAKFYEILLNNLKIDKSDERLGKFYDILSENPIIKYFTNRLDKKLILTRPSMKKEKFQKGIFCLINMKIKKNSNWKESNFFHKEITEHIVENRNWIFNEGTKLELGDCSNEYPEDIDGFVTGLKKYIKKQPTRDCIIVLIVRYEEWNSKQESIEVYSTLLRALSEVVRNEYNLPTVCIIQDDLRWEALINNLPITEEFQYTKEDTKPFEEIVADYPNMYFVLPYADYGVDLFNELNKPHSRSLRDLNTVSLMKKVALTKKRQFSKVICISESEEMDFIFPAMKISRVDT